MVATAARIDDGPSAFRYPRGEGEGVEIDLPTEPLEIGKGRVLREGNMVAILSFGTRLGESMKAAEDLTAKGYSTTVADARFCKPLDEDLVCKLARNHDVLITIEEGAIGGFAAHVMQCLERNGILDEGLKIRTMMLPDLFIDHDAPATMYAAAALNAPDIVATALGALGALGEEQDVGAPRRA
jgi:1-deoxy-D-xylulose-5-phosphate synthase